MIHIIDETAKAIHAHELKRIGLLGTAFTMSDGFYTERMQKLGLDVITPKPEQQDEIHRIIFEELCCGQIRDSSRDYYLAQIENLMSDGV